MSLAHAIAQTMQAHRLTSAQVAERLGETQDRATFYRLLSGATGKVERCHARSSVADQVQRRRSSRLTAKYKGAYRPRPRSISTWKAKKFVVCPFYEQMGATRGATALTLWPKRPFPCRNLDLRYVRA